ncbi:MAG: STAS domain-containing protein [Planctomycetes bacterium]|nr:STAS domain-containing protein [Planctomycetota bacterium]
MPINEWSDTILIAILHDEPAFSEDMETLMGRLEEPDASLPHVVLNIENVTYMNSSNIAQLLKVRKRLIDGGSRLRLCAINDQIWGIMLATGLDSVFDFTEDVSTAIASLQIQ